jgi:hypothetical protein
VVFEKMLSKFKDKFSKKIKLNSFLPYILDISIFENRLDVL